MPLAEHTNAPPGRFEVKPRLRDDEPASAVYGEVKSV
jgi:hypothetical protein